MEMKECPICGEKYSTTYKTCPFCEEEEAIRRGKPIHRRVGDYRNRRGGHSVRIMALLLVLIVCGASVWGIWGDNIATKLGIRDTDVEPEHGDDSGVVSVDSDPIDVHTDPDAPETAVVLSQEELYFDGAGEMQQLIASGGSGTYSWNIDNIGVATITNDGVLQTVANGSATVLVSDGYTTATCKVQVGEPGSDTPDTPVPPPSSDPGSLTLNREDFTLSKGESFQLKLSGSSNTPTWSIADSSVASVSSDGTVKGISRGNTTVSATVDGHTVKCIVRVK